MILDQLWGTQFMIFMRLSKTQLFDLAHDDHPTRHGTLLYRICVNGSSSGVLFC